MIKVVTPEDFEIVDELISALMKESVYSKIFENYKMTQEMFISYTTQNNLQNKMAVLCYDEDKPVAIGVFDILPWTYCDAPVKIARLAYIYVKPEHRHKGFRKQIEKAFEYWGKKAGASYYSVGMKTDGYAPVETIYMKEVE